MGQSLVQELPGQMGAADSLCQRSVSSDPHCCLCLLCRPVPVALLTGVGSLRPNPTFSSGCLASCCHRSLQGREGLARGLGTEFVLCVRMCVLSCSRFDFEGLESGDDGAFDKLRSWSRSIEDLQPPSALSAPFTNSLARSARQSVLRYVCSRSARLPPPAPVQVPGNSGECSCSTLASRLSSLALCLPVCLWSVLSVSLTLPSDLSWVSTSPSAVPTPSGVPALPFSPPLWGPLHSSFSLCHSSQPFRQGLSSPSSLTFTGGSSSSPPVCFPLAPHSVPSAARRPAPTHPARCSPPLHLFL